ncbi:phosphotransferase [Sporosarcina limicola]|uniref:Thiamine kinase-like enzyme n=1 Tax=Sporosarcina limicola TaxID=34101 RepID=A0A927R3L5_9BACL|nr:phosphotransferase [Sporosarcina limicola]MBE1553893.1 thiamine kinase-like enzyme [Sporosarcina limicola]
MSSNDEIIRQWRHFGWNDKFKNVLGKNVKLVEKKIECLKNSREKTSIWKLLVTYEMETIPIVLKIYKPPLKENHIVEVNMYQKANKVLHEFMPKVYWIEQNVNAGEIWMFIEYVRPLRGQIKLVPKHFNNIIPTVAKFHAATFENRILQHGDIFNSWLPYYDSKSMVLERSKHIEKTKEYFDLAMKDPGLRGLVEPSYNVIQQILQKGPVFFPEMKGSGQSLIHGDLHVHNISCQNASENPDWGIRLVDWESAKYAPGWFDLVVLVEILIDFRKDWQNDAEEIRKHCVHLYSEEMKKHGITFQTDPLQLLKMTYLQRTLEKRLLNHLRRVLRGEKSALLERYLEKTIVWGKELGLY